MSGSCLALARKDKTRTLLLLLSVTVKTFTIQNQGQTSDYCLAFLFKSFFLDEHVYVCSGVEYRHNERSLKQRSDSGTFPLQNLYTKYSPLYSPLPAARRMLPGKYKFRTATSSLTNNDIAFISQLAHQKLLIKAGVAEIRHSSSAIWQLHSLLINLDYTYYFLVIVCSAKATSKQQIHVRRKAIKG